MSQLQGRSTGFAIGAGLVMALPALGACTPTPGPDPLDPSTAQAACLDAVEVAAGTAGGTLERTDVDAPNAVVFVNLPGGGIWSCSADLSGRVFDVRDAAIRL